MAFVLKNESICCYKNRLILFIIAFILDVGTSFSDDRIAFTL